MQRSALLVLVSTLRGSCRYIETHLPSRKNYARTKYGISSRTTTSFGQRARDARTCRPGTVFVHTLGDKLAVTLRDGPRRNSSAKRVHPTTLRPIRHKNDDAGILYNL